MKSSEITLDEFLEQLAGQLGDLPPHRREEILSETRGHLEAMVVARRADGLDASSAWQDAQRCFGEADAIGGELAREWKRAPCYETEGTPLSGWEKTRVVVGSVVPGLLFFVAAMAILPWLQMHKLAGVFFLVVTPLLWLFMGWRHRKKQGTLTPTAIFGLLYGFALTMMLAVQIQFADQLRGTALEVVLKAPLSPGFGPIAIVGGLLLALWVKRENKTVLPWRRWKRYSSNPIATEEEYRFSHWFGRVISTLVPCVGTLLMGAGPDMSMRVAVCVGIIAMNVIIGRWLR